MMISGFILLSSLIALSLGCCTPDQWEGYQGALIGYSGFLKRGLVEQSKFISYDFTNKRSAVFITDISGDTERKYKVLVRFGDKCGNCGDGSLYIVDLKSDKCFKKSLKGEFRKICVPEKAKNLGNFFLGVKGGFKVQGYYFGKESSGYNNWLTVENVGENVCAPVSEQVTGKYRHVSFLDAVTFADITTGIKNETIFDVPKSCTEKSDFPLPKGLDSKEKFVLAF